MPLNHFTDPHHPLHETPQYSHDQAGNCSICLLGLAGHRGRGCNFCNIHLHAACAGYFQETITFFAHPLHALRLIRSPGRLCDICDRDCPPGSFVYSCIGCGFDVHALCTMLPERVANPYHPGHELRMVFSLHGSGSCSACHQQLPVWRYSCSPGEELHIACAVNPPTATPASGSMGSYAQSIHHGASLRGG
nr:unnamed protein product [Digitaria exilis]